MRNSCKIYLTNEKGDRFFGPGPAELLERVARCGSLSRAAVEMHLSYSKALRMIRTAEREFGFALLHSEAGGASGGGSALTPRAQEVLLRFRAWESDSKAASHNAFSLHFSGILDSTSGQQ